MPFAGFLSTASLSVRSRWRRYLAALVTVLVAATVVAVGRHHRPQPACPVSASLAPSCGAWWGAAPNSRDTALPKTVASLETATGRRLDIVHTYHRWNDAFPTATETQLSRTGRVVFSNWEPVTAAGDDISWADIAAGDQDVTIRAEAKRLAALASPILVSFSHEPELNDRAHGAISDYAAAYRRVVTLSKQSGATNVRWVWDLMGLTDPVWLARYRTMWPGAAYVDWIGWDPYNAASCKQRAWQSFAQTVTPFYRWLQSQPFTAGKPLMLAEYGSVEGASADDKAAWFAAVPAALAQLPRLKALLYFDLPAPPANCDWLVTTSPASAKAFGALARSAPFRRSADHS